ncbi:unnamed protein product [Macrosiphum euphorbiae]|uniref:ATP synthase F0 subunit 8 n=1 Tax=Macrosiphum euphorbiae TaxID=13131 RepID=A0AAV0Y5R0_9HEMI|nr:unnamed protein product [Macrosiphum euphorbiae]
MSFSLGIFVIFVIVEITLLCRCLFRNKFSPSPLRQSQMDEWLRSFSSIQSSPDILPLDVVGGVVFSNSSRQSEINEWFQSLSPISPSVLNIIVRPQVLPEFDVLIFGRISNTTQPSQNATDWAEDGYNDILELHMMAHEAVWSDDEVLNMDTNEDEELNRHMDEYEGKN